MKDEVEKMILVCILTPVIYQVVRWGLAMQQTEEVRA